MKDIRLVEFPDGGIGIFTRPRGEVGGRGTIGYVRIEKLEELSAEVVDSAELLRGQFLDEEWGGVNEADVLANGQIGVLCHIACYDARGHKHYYPATFCFDSIARRAGPVKIVAARRFFSPGPIKRPELGDVCFGGGLLRRSDETATLYAGVSDAWAGRLDIQDPFLEYEQ